MRDVILPNEDWRLVSGDHRDVKGPTCGANGDVYFIDAAVNKIVRIDGDGEVKEFLADARHANSLSMGADGKLYAVSSVTGKLWSFDKSGKESLIVDDLPGHHVLALPNGGLYVTSNADTGAVWFVKNGKKTQVDTGLKFATGLAYRPDQWLLSVADGRSKWAYSYQINADGTLTNKERFFWLHVPDWEDDAGADSLCYAKEGPMLVATRWGIQVCADDGPTQVILPMPDRSRVTGVCLGGRDMDTLFAFCGGKIWRRKVKIHAVGAFTTWTPVHGTPL